MCLVTNVLSKRRLSDRQIVDIYKARWGVELFFRTFKQTSGVASFAAMRRRMLVWKSTGRWWGCGVFVCGQRELVQFRSIRVN